MPNPTKKHAQDYRLSCNVIKLLSHLSNLKIDFHACDDSEDLIKDVQLNLLKLCATSKQGNEHEQQ